MAAIPKTLEDALRDGFVVPFIGAGVSRAVTRKDRPGKAMFPCWSELLELAAVRLRDDGKLHEAQLVQGLLHKRTPDYLQAARHAREGLGPVWYRLLRETFDPPFDKIDESSLGLARTIWKLPGKLVLTTNYDQVLRWALARPHDLVQLNIEATSELSAMLRDKIDRPTVWHLHGHIHDAQKLILTPDGYSELYPERNEEPRYQAALTSLRHLLAARTFLFVGFSLDDERFGDQLRWVSQTFQGATGPHYLLVKESGLRDAQRRLEHLDSIEFLPFADYGQKLIDCIEEIATVGAGMSEMPHPEPQQPASAAAAARTPKSVDIDVKSLPRSLGRESPGASVFETRNSLAPISTGPAAALEDPILVVRRSFREVYSFQRRIFDRLSELSDALARLSIEFDRWDPSYHSRPARSSSEFFRRNYWAWDFLPGFHLTLMWQSLASQGATVRGVVLMIETDTGFRKPGDHREPDPKDFVPAEDTHSELRIDLYRLSDASANWNQAWKVLSQQSGVRDGNDHTVKLGTGECVYRYLRVELGAAISKQGLLTHVITPIQSWFKDGD